MRLSPPEPSFLDQRNAILQADANDAPAGQDADRIWAAFASRGMGWFASVDSAADVRADEDFSLPPAPAAGSATVQGRVRDDAGAGQPGVPVGFAGHDTGLGPDLSATTAASGDYAIAAVPAGAYPRLRAAAPTPGLLDGVADDVAVPASGSLTRDLVLRRNWASVQGGASVRSFSGTDFSLFGCGPPQALDGDPSTGWSTDAVSSEVGPAGPKQLVVRLPDDVTITGIEIDPSPVCGDLAEAQLGAFRLKVARDDDGEPGPFQTVATGSFAPADLGAAHAVALAGPSAGARYVQLQALGNNGDPFFMDVAELQVLGHVTTPAEGGGGTAAPEVATLAADAAATTANSATFRADVTPHGAATVVHVAYGLAAGQLAYQTADVPVPGNERRTVSLTAGALLPNTTYHYRAVATNSRGTVTGAEMTVTTAAAPIAQPGPKGDAGVAGPPGTTGAPAPPAVVRKPAARPAVACALRGTRAVTCTFSPGTARVDGARARLSRQGRTLAGGVVHGRVLRLRARAALRRGSYILTLTRGRGATATVTRRAVRF
jgi:hypothetical protein